MRPITWAANGAAPRDEQPAPGMRCNATAHDDCDPNDDVRAPGCSSSSRRHARDLCGGEPHSKGAGRITQSQASLEPLPDGCELWNSHGLLDLGRAVVVPCLFARVRYSILRQYFRGGRDLPLTARTNRRAGSLRRGREKLSGGRRGRARAPGPGAPRALLRRRRPGCIRRAGRHGGRRAASGHG